MPIKRSTILVICLKELNKPLCLRSHPFDPVTVQELQGLLKDVRWYRRLTVHLGKVIQVFVAGAGPVLMDVVAQAIKSGMAGDSVAARMNWIDDEVRLGRSQWSILCDGRLLDCPALAF